MKYSRGELEFRAVVEEVEDDELEIDLEAARESDPECEVGDSSV